MIKKIVELYSYRELLLNLVVKELKVKYRGSLLGFFWSLLHPALLILVYTFAFSIILSGNRMPDFPLFLMAGLLPWQAFSNSLSAGTNSIIGNSGLIKKIYFPRELFPLSITLANGFNLLIEMGLLLVLLTIFGYQFWPYLPIVAVALLLQLLLTTGLGLLVSAITVYLRDMKQLIPLLLRMGFFLTPIIYPLERFDKIPDIYQQLLRLNPMASIVMLYKLPLYYNKMPGAIIFVAALVTSLSFFVLGYVVFNRLSPSFAKEI